MPDTLNKVPKTSKSISTYARGVGRLIWKFRDFKTSSSDSSSSSLVCRYPRAWRKFRTVTLLIIWAKKTKIEWKGEQGVRIEVIHLGMVNKALHNPAHAFISSSLLVIPPYTLHLPYRITCTPQTHMLSKLLHMLFPVSGSPSSPPTPPLLSLPLLPLSLGSTHLPHPTLQEVIFSIG